LEWIDRKLAGDHAEKHPGLNDPWCAPRLANCGGSRAQLGD